MLGFLLACFLLFFLFVGLMVSMVKMTKNEKVVVADKTVLIMNCNTDIPDRTDNNPFDRLAFSSNTAMRQLGLNDYLTQLRKAAADTKVSGVFLDLSDIEAGMATVEELRSALLEFHKSGKFIIAYSESYSQKAYYLATVADKIYLNPAGGLEFKGLAAQVMFFKGLLDKVDVEAQIIRHGKFKSAVEPFMLDKMSDASREQTSAFVNTMWTKILAGVSAQRGIPVESLTAIADSFSIQSPDNAVQYHMIDKVAYKDEVFDEIRTRVKSGSIKDINFMKIGKYVSAPDPKPLHGKDKIAIVYASGDIVSGNSDGGAMGSETISRAIRKARLDERVKAVVLRVNSPGGSALASEVIWREVSLTRKVKPIVVSMGNVAASGGYYISCAANRIFASPNTITGSIGVFGLIPNMKKMFNQDLGITFDGVKTNPYADYITVSRPLTDSEKRLLTHEIEDIYSSFISHVAAGRNLTTAQVDSIGQGRVWSGADAKRIGLIDDFGGLEDAVNSAANLAKLKDYSRWELPESKEPLEQLMEIFSDENSSRLLAKNLGTAYPYLQFIQRMGRMQGVQASLPFVYDIK